MKLYPVVHSPQLEEIKEMLMALSDRLEEYKVQLREEIDEIKAHLQLVRQEVAQNAAASAELEAANAKLDEMLTQVESISDEATAEDVPEQPPA